VFSKLTGARSVIIIGRTGLFHFLFSRYSDVPICQTFRAYTQEGQCLPPIGSVPLPVKPYLLGKPLPGPGQPVKAASREAVA
jgi:hypothetical protein